MIRHSIVPAFAVLLLLSLAGCSAQRVSTNTFLAPAVPAGSIAPGSTVAVIANDQVPNPIFDRLVKDKLEASLRRRGFTLADAAQAPYHLRYAYDLQGETAPLRRTFFSFPGLQGFYGAGSGDHDSYFGAGLGFGTFVNDPHTQYAAKLRLRLSRPVPGTAPAQDEVLWVGEAIAETDSPDLRKMMNYLVAALFRYFMEDSGETRSLKLSGKDPEVGALTGRNP